MGPKSEYRRGRGGNRRGFGRPSGRGRGSNTREKMNDNGTPMGERERLFSDCSESQCPVCWSDVDIFAVGMCNHHVCQVCSTRMRVLCSQNECPICRQDMPKIFHTRTRRRYEDVADLVLPMNKKFRVCFESGDVKRCFEHLLRHQCPVCAKDEQVNLFVTFKQLDTHVRREHELFFCDLCSDNLKIFSHERKLYSRKDLATHRRKGDPDDSSHKGHPLCEFCEVRFVDEDELFRHLRRDHYFCHFCDADGLQHYYPDYGYLRDHFKSEHFLCDEGDCADEQFTHAFRTEIDLKAHRAERHSSGFTKNAAKQNRVVDVDLTFNRPGFGSFNQHGRRNGRENSPGREFSGFSGNEGGSADQPERVPDLTQDFPTLGNNSVGAGVAQNPSNNLAQRLAISAGRNVQKSWATGIGGPNLERDFPSLPGGSSQPQNRAKNHNYLAMASGGRNGAKEAKNGAKKAATSRDSFPSLPSASSSSMSQFSQPVYRNLAGHTPAWSAANNGGDDSENRPVSSQPIPRKARSVAPPPELGFPSLGAPANPQPAPNGRISNGNNGIGNPIVNGNDKENIKNAPGDTKEEKKNKFKPEGALVGEDLVNKTSKAKKGANLQSAADLIFKDKVPVENNDSNKVDGMSEEVGVGQRTSDDKLEPETGPPPEAAPKPVPKKLAPKSGCEDFPTLGPSKASLNAQFGTLNFDTPDNVKKPPPGFAKKAKSGPPPGFGGATRPVQKHAFREPVDFHERNGQLVIAISRALGGGKSVEFKDFKSASSKYKSGDIGADGYIDECLKLSGSQGNLETFLPELIALLPNIDKQRQLMDVHANKFPASNLGSKLLPCDTCGQILIKSDVTRHRASHAIDADFPALGN